MVSKNGFLVCVPGISSGFVTEWTVPRFRPDGSLVCRLGSLPIAGLAAPPLDDALATFLSLTHESPLSLFAEVRLGRDEADVGWFRPPESLSSADRGALLAFDGDARFDGFGADFDRCSAGGETSYSSSSTASPASVASGR